MSPSVPSAFLRFIPTSTEIMMTPMMTDEMMMMRGVSRWSW